MCGEEGAPNRRMQNGGNRQPSGLEGPGNCESGGIAIPNFCASRVQLSPPRSTQAKVPHVGPASAIPTTGLHLGNPITWSQQGIRRTLEASHSVISVQRSECQKEKSPEVPGSDCSNSDP